MEDKTLEQYQPIVFRRLHIISASPHRPCGHGSMEDATLSSAGSALLNRLLLFRRVSLTLQPYFPSLIWLKHMSCGQSAGTTKLLYPKFVKPLSISQPRSPLNIRLLSGSLKQTGSISLSPTTASL